jgi:hypothetical protein
MGSLTEGLTRNDGGGARCRACGGVEKGSLTAQSVAGQMAEA